MTAYAQVNRQDDTLHQVLGLPDIGDVGPPTPPPDEDGYDYHLVTRLDFWQGQPHPGAILKWNNGEPQWYDPRVLEQCRGTAIAKCYTDIDAVVEAAVGRRDGEYTKALTEAQAFADSGYAGTVPRSIAKFAQKNPTMQEQTPQWAAQQVIGRALALEGAQDDMRDQRFESQWAMRAATTLIELDAAVAVWDDFISDTRTQLGLPEAST